MMDLQRQILIDDRVKEALSWQRPDGWLGESFHGEREPETGIRFLIEKGIDPKNRVITAALDAILDRKSEFDRGSLERVGKLLDAYRLGGSQMIKACVFSYAGQEEHDFVWRQVEEALYGFSAVFNVEDGNHLYRLHKGSLPVFNEGMIWPSIYHLRLLAYTQSWRKPSNRRLLCDALNHMLRLCPLPEIKLLHKGQPIAPAQMNFMNDLNKPLLALAPNEWMLWFHRTELIARLGVAADLPAVSKQLHALLNILESGNWLFDKPLSHYYFHKWSPYIGLALENDWRKKRKRVSDLTFRCLLILKYSGLLSRLFDD